MDMIYFLVRHTPFWAFPVLIIGGEFAYISWLKSKLLIVRICAVLVIISLVAIVYYYMAGGPEKAVKNLIHFLMELDLVQ